MSGRTLKSLEFTRKIIPRHIAVKEAVFPFIKFPGVDTILGPEMKSTGEVMGISYDFGMAFGKAQLAAGSVLPVSGTAFISVKNADKKRGAEIGLELFELGFKIIATRGTSIAFIENNVPSEYIRKVKEGRPNIVDAIVNGQVQLIINTTVGKQSIRDSFSIRRSALDKGIPYITTLQGAHATVQAVKSMQRQSKDAKPLQEYYKKII
jgi:carbamoyl-phosphate synthase large subunit